MKTRDIAEITMMTSLLVVLGYIPGIPVGFIPVPIILQNLGVMLAGAILGAKKGSLSVALLLLVGIVFPVFSGGTTTLAVLSGPTAGYVLAWLLVPSLIALGLSLLKQPNTVLTFIAIWLAGVLFVDVVGSVWLALYTKADMLASLLSNLVFIPGDTLKALLATAISIQYKRFLKPSSKGVG